MTSAAIETTPIILSLQQVELTDDQFYCLCQANPNLKLERNNRGELLIMPPVGGVSGNFEADLITEVNLWNRQTKLGYVFSSSTIFRLLNGGDRSPDVAWVRRERWEALTLEEQEKFPPLCPDFAIELRSRTDSLKLLQEKMEEYLNSGLKLGWLIAPQNRQAEIYRPQRSTEILFFPINQIVRPNYDFTSTKGSEILSNRLIFEILVLTSR